MKTCEIHCYGFSRNIKNYMKFNECLQNDAFHSFIYLFIQNERSGNEFWSYTEIYIFGRKCPNCKYKGLVLFHELLIRDNEVFCYSSYFVNKNMNYYVCYYYVYSVLKCKLTVHRSRGIICTNKCFIITGNRKSGGGGGVAVL